MMEVNQNHKVEIYNLLINLRDLSNAFNQMVGSLYSGICADEINEIQSPCEIEGCNNKAICHIRYIDGVRDNGDRSVAIETGNVTYKSVCRKHWKEQ